VAHPGFQATYRTRPGQTYGWDRVLALGAPWFHDNGESAANLDGSFRGRGISNTPLQLIRVDLSSGRVTTVEICGAAGGLIANPPLIDGGRRIAVGYDSGNGMLAAFDITADGALTLRWRRDHGHASHLPLLPEDGALVTGDHDRKRKIRQVVVVEITTGADLARADTGGSLQSGVVPALGWNATVYRCSVSTVSRQPSAVSRQPSAVSSQQFG
jgi:hypothetical protein